MDFGGRLQQASYTKKTNHPPERGITKELVVKCPAHGAGVLTQSDSIGLGTTPTA